MYGCRQFNHIYNQKNCFIIIVLGNVPGMVGSLDSFPFLDIYIALSCPLSAIKERFPLYILQRRFASGEITNEVYQ